MTLFRSFLSVSLLLLLVASVVAQPRELEWEELIPAHWDPYAELEELGIDDMADDDPRVEEVMEALRLLWRVAPVVEELEGKQVKIPGFVVPLENDGRRVREFLLVPYFGACIHVPPPPSNQTVHVIAPPGRPYRGELFDTVWVSGPLSIVPTHNELGDSGYRIHAEQIEKYSEEY